MMEGNQLHPEDAAIHEQDEGRNRLCLIMIIITKKGFRLQPGLGLLRQADERVWIQKKLHSLEKRIVKTGKQCV
jgi:hypothetical protein